MSDAHKRLDGLLLARATEGLNPPDTVELTRLLAAHPDVDPAVYEQAAAVISLVALHAPPPMPPSLRAALEQRATEFIERAGTRAAR